MGTPVFDIKAIHPKQGDKYSPNLYKWLTCREKSHRSWTSRVFTDKEGSLWIGFIDDELYLIGCRLMQVLCSGEKADSAAFLLKHIGPLEEVADFWERYLADGRCAIDTAHKISFVGGATRWMVDGDSRDCLWCGKVNQKRERYTVTTDHERWV